MLLKIYFRFIYNFMQRIFFLIMSYIKVNVKLILILIDPAKKHHESQNETMDYDSIYRNSVFNRYLLFHWHQNDEINVDFTTRL